MNPILGNVRRWWDGRKPAPEPKGMTWGEYIMAAPNRAERRRRMAQARSHAPGLRDLRAKGGPWRRAFRGIASLPLRAGLAEIGLSRTTKEIA